MNTIIVKNPKKGSISIQNISTAEELAKQLHLTEPAQALAVRVNGVLLDLNTLLKSGDEVEFIDFEDPLGKEVFWHTSAHLLAQAILRLYPQALPTIGPPIEQGFYYDFANLTLSDEDFPKIEAEMEAIVKENFKSERQLISGKEDALKLFGKNKYKKELIESFGNETITAYRQGEFLDLCRGPHLPFLGKIKALKILKTSGAYWRGDSSKEMLTRIYGITFPDRKQLKDFLHQLEEAKKRDHKVLGPRLGLFSLCEEAPGMPFIHPEGMIVWNELLSYWRQCHRRAHYQEIKTPQLMSKELWEISGHWQNYRQNMYTSIIDDREFAIKPMNCPGCMLYYKTAVHSYREMPLRVAEIGHVHRHEASGALSGLMRVRCFHQDDAHIFCLPQQITDEILDVLKLVDQIYSTFGLHYHLELSTRPENSIGSDEAWEETTEALRRALDQSKRAYKINEGDGAFYGPKIDAHIRDAIGRTWQCGTIQLDMSLPERFELVYDDDAGGQKRPIMIHRALFGSIERFFGILIEHFAGRFPLWLSPRQIHIIPVADRHVDYARVIEKDLFDKGYHVYVNDSHESVNKKIRHAQLLQVNYMLTIGDKELEEKTISVRTREGVQAHDLKLEEFLSRIDEERISKALDSSFKEGMVR